jgi:hypothetical protein
MFVAAYLSNDASFELKQPLENSPEVAEGYQHWSADRDEFHRLIAHPVTTKHSNEVGRRITSKAAIQAATDSKAIKPSSGSNRLCEVSHSLLHVRDLIT